MKQAHKYFCRKTRCTSYSSLEFCVGSNESGGGLDLGGDLIERHCVELECDCLGPIRDPDRMTFQSHTTFLCHTRTLSISLAFINPLSLSFFLALSTYMYAPSFGSCFAPTTIRKDSYHAGILAQPKLVESHCPKCFCNVKGHQCEKRSKE